MRIGRVTMLILSFLLFTSDSLRGQDRNQPLLTVIGQEKIDRLPGSWVDRWVKFRIINTTRKNLLVYGVKHEDGLFPFRYLLECNEACKFVGGKPLPWTKTSQIYKSVEILKPGETLTFQAAFSTFYDLGKRHKITVYAAFHARTEPFEIRSDEFIVQ